MTNGTTPTENGVADAAAMIAALNPTADTTTDISAEPKAPSFDDLGLHPDVKLALDDMGYFAPTPVQTAVFKPVNDGKDLLVQSRTGTGKTTAFGLPIVNRMVPAARQCQALILTPTRELALQVARELAQIGKHRGIVIEAVYGGAPIGKQIKALKDGVHVVVGTPGRVLDHIGRRTLDLKTVTTFVLDECDEMLSMGFLEDIEKITSYLPEKHQTALFSATMPDEVTRYARRHMPQREMISLSRDQVSVTDIHHAYYIVSGIARSRDLLKIIFAEEPESAIIFCNTRDETTLVAKFLQKQGLDAEPLSSDLSQSDRERVMGRMKAKNLRFLCATDVAARGIDISNLSHVINYSVPESPEVYVHRTGRTGRAGKKGTALSLVGPRELGNFRYVRLTFGIKPEERLLPKDDIFIGKLKVPLPPVGVPQAPDPVQILIRGVTGQANELETKIFEKLLGSMNGKRVLAALVAEKLNTLSTKASPRPRRERTHDGEGGGEERGERPRFDRDRPRFGEGGDRGERGDRPRFDRDRPRFGEGGEREERGDRGERGDRDRGERGDRPRFDRDRPRFGEGGERGERPRFGGEERGERPRSGEGGERGERPRFGEGGERGERPRFGEGGERTERGDRGDRGERSERGDRDRGERGDRGDRGDRGERRFDRDRGDRPRFDRDRGERRDRDDRPRREERHGHEERVGGMTAEGTAPVPADSTLPAQPTMGSVEPAAEATAATDTTLDRGNRDERHARGDRDRGERGDRDRGDRGGRDRGERGNREDRGNRDERHARGDREDRHGRGERGDRHRDRDDRRDRGEERPRTEAEATTAEASTEAPTAEVSDTATTSPKLDDAARTATDRADKGKKRDKRSSAPTEETKEFWETWAENKSTAPAAEPARASADGEEASETEERGERSDRKSRGRDRDRGRGRDKKDDRHAKDDRKAKKSEKDDERPAKKDDGKKAAAAGDGNQARLFISLGKKHGVSADDLRKLLAAPIGGDTARIGSVSLRDSHAHVRVAEELVDDIIAGVHGTSHNDHEVTVERARA